MRTVIYLSLPKKVKFNKSMINRKTGFGGLCLAWTRQCFLYDGKVVPAVHATAYIAWQATKRRHKGYNPPYGVPVWFGPSKYSKAGHVAFSLGDGLCRTTNSSTGRLHNMRIKDIEKGWGQEYLGWSEDINGVRVYKKPAVKKKYNGKLDRPTIIALQRALKTKQDGVISDRVVIVSHKGNRAVTTKGRSQMVVALQKKFGTVQDGNISAPSDLIRKMQKKYKMKHVDGYLSYPRSDLIAEVQRRLDVGQF